MRARGKLRGGHGETEERGIRESGSRQTVRLSARYVRNGVSLYRAQPARVDSLLGLSLEELPLPLPIGTARPLPPIMHSSNTQTPRSAVSVEFFQMTVILFHVQSPCLFLHLTPAEV